MAAPRLVHLTSAAQTAAGAVVLRRLARGRTRRAALTIPAAPVPVAVSAVVPARNEAGRILPCLRGLIADPGISEVVLVDDGSTDDTAAIARALGARVIAAGDPPDGWVGKPWALQRGLEAAAGEVVLSLDADTRPEPGLGQAIAAALIDADLVSVGARFECETVAERLLHPAMLATLVYRFGPPDSADPVAPERLLVNGQCTGVRRQALLDAGGYRHAAGHMTDDAAQARALARRGWRVAFHDSAGLVSVDMHDSARDTWREWGRSIALRDVTSNAWMAADVAVVWLALAVPVARGLLGRAGWLDRLLIALRLSVLAATAPAYTRRGAPYWLSALADPLAAMRLTVSAVRPPRHWRGRAYGARGTAVR